MADHKKKKTFYVFLSSIIFWVGHIHIVESSLFALQSNVYFKYCIQGFRYFAGKKSQISRDFQAQIHGKISRFRRIFAGEKSKFAEKSADFPGF